MMAQRLMTEKRDDPFSDSRFFVGKMRPSLDDIENPTRFSDMAMPAYATGATASLFAPGAGVTDIMGYAPDPAQPGEFLPSFGQNITQGNYLDAGLQALGGAGDVMMAGGAFVPPLVGVGAALKAPRAARVAGQAADVVKIEDALRQKYPDVDLDVSETSQKLTLSKIVVPEGQRSSGVGTAVMSDLIAYADQRGLPVGLTPSTAFGGSKGRLQDFYKRFGFVPNKGRNKDFTFKETFVRQPQVLDPNQQMGDALAQAQARYFETGNFEPPTAENPVSVVLPTETEPGIIAFHGSGADFDEFRLEMIGTGEGAQAYGYGLYFTDSEDIAKFYKDAVGGSGLQLPSGQRFRFTTQGDVDDLFEVLNVPFRAGLGSDPNATNMSLIEDFSKIRLGGGAVAEFRKQPFDTRERVLDAYANDISNHMIEAVEETDDPAAGVKYLRELADSDRYDVYERSKGYVPEDRAKVERAMVLEAADQLELLVNKGFKKLQTGKVYKVALSPKPDELLDYDLPLSQQPEMLKLIDDAHGDSEIILKQAGLDPATATGGQLVNALGGIAQTIEQQKAGADFLLKAGIPGIKYRASGSRGAGVTDEAAERNYVIFDDKAVRILEKYGIVGPVLVTGGAVAATQRGGDEEGSIFPDA